MKFLELVLNELKDTITRSLMSKSATENSGFLCDGLEDGVAAYLLEKGVPKADIVPAFYSPEKRKSTEFAVV